MAHLFGLLALRRRQGLPDPLDVARRHGAEVFHETGFVEADLEEAGIMDALRWKSPRMPLAYNRNLAAEQGAAGRLTAKLG